MGKALTTIVAALSLLLLACGNNDGSIVGTWVGYVEGPGFGLSSDRIEVRVTEVAADGSITGTIAFGAPGSLAPVSNSDIGYPEGQRWELGFGQMLFVEKFSYTLSGSFDEVNRRLQGSRNPSEVWSEWCALQTPYATEDRYMCLPNCASLQNGDYCELQCESAELSGQVDCGQLVLCGGIEGVCECDGDGCGAAGAPVPTVDLHVDGDDLRGSLEGFGMAFLVRQ